MGFVYVCVYARARALVYCVAQMPCVCICVCVCVFVVCERVCVSYLRGQRCRDADGIDVDGIDADLGDPRLLNGQIQTCKSHI